MLGFPIVPTRFSYSFYRQSAVKRLARLLPSAYSRQVPELKHRLTHSPIGIVQESVQIPEFKLALRPDSGRQAAYAANCTQCAFIIP